MDNNKTIIVIGAGDVLSADLIAQIKHSHGIDMIVISDKEAKEKGIIDIGMLKIDKKPFIFKKLPEFKMPVLDIKQSNKNDCKKGWRNK